MNRLDEYVVFNRLSKQNLRGIVKIEAKRLEARLADKEITMTLSESALDYLSDVGYDPVYGARPLKRTLQREVETKVARGILNGEFLNGDSIFVTANNNGIIVGKTLGDDSYETIDEKTITVDSGEVTIEETGETILTDRKKKRRDD